MNWDAIGAVGELMGALAVVGTLAYLAVQIRQGTALARATAQREVNLAFQASIDRFREDPQVFQKGCTQFQNLSRKDQLTFDLMIAPMVVHLDQAIRMYNEGLETEDNVNTYGGVVLSILKAPGAKYWYDRIEMFTASEARKYLSARLADPADSLPAFVDVLPWHCPDEPPDERANS